MHMPDLRPHQPDDYSVLPTLCLPERFNPHHLSHFPSVVETSFISALPVSTVSAWLCLENSQEASNPVPFTTQERTQPPEPLLLTAGSIFLLLSAEVSPHDCPLPLHTGYDPPTHDRDQDERFTQRLSGVRSRIERLITRRWYGDFDAYELDNLIQAGLVYLWNAYRRDPNKLDGTTDAYWCAIAKRGAYYEIAHEYSQRYRKQGSSRHGKRTLVETVLSTGDLLAARMAQEGSSELDETSLSSETCYTHDTAEIQEADQRIDIPRLERLIFQGTHPTDHPIMRQILGYMREGLTKTEMAECAGVKVATIRCTIRRMQQACGAAQEAKKNRQKPGASLDERICTYRKQGLGGTEIARLIGRDWTFVYRRLHIMQLM
jgi:hypothetical protein